MILENRQILFTNKALRHAFAWYQAVPAQTDLPPGAIVAVEPRGGGGAMVSVQAIGAARHRECLFPSSKVIGVLLYFCRRQRIPIPRDGTKELTLAEDGLMMTIDVEIKTAGPPT